LPQWKRNVYVLWLAVFIGGICWTMVMPFMPVYLEQLGVTHGTEFWSGIIIAASSVCAMVMSPIWGAIGDRYGRRIMMLRAGVCLLAGYVLTALAVGPISLMGARLWIGLLTGYTPMAVALVGVSAPRQEVGWALGIVQTAFPTGSIIGPVVGGVLSDWVGVRGASWASAAIIAVSVSLVALIVREDFTPTPSAEKSLVKELQAAASHKLLMAIVLISALSQASSMALEPVLVPFVKQMVGASAPGWLSGLLFSIPGVAFILMAPWWARRGERLGFERTVAAGLLGCAVLYLLQAFAGGAWQLGTLRLSLGVSGAAIDPGVAALLATVVPRNLRGRAFGLNQAANNAGSIVGPLLGGWIASYMDPRGVFVLTCLFCLIGYGWVKRIVGPQVREAAAALEAQEA
jgi:MFS transporter, DHA1 family, multidrug resistance protein